MSRVLTFARQFPTYHPKAGTPTHFIEKLIESFLELGNIEVTDEQLRMCDPDVMRPDVWSKWTTIRAGNKWKVGDMFSPRVWSGKPYNSPQITIAPDIRVEKVWDFEIRIKEIPGAGKQPIAFINDEVVLGSKHILLAMNDGLTNADLVDWLQPKQKPTPFSGQIICWNPAIEY